MMRCGGLQSDPYQKLPSQTGPPSSARQPLWKAPPAHLWETVWSKRINGPLPNDQLGIYYPARDNKQHILKFYQNICTDLVAVQSESGLKFFLYFVKVELWSTLSCPDQAIGDILDHP